MFGMSPGAHLPVSLVFLASNVKLAALPCLAPNSCTMTRRVYLRTCIRVIGKLECQLFFFPQWNLLLRLTFALSLSRVLGVQAKRLSRLSHHRSLHVFPQQVEEGLLACSACLSPLSTLSATCIQRGRTLTPLQINSRTIQRAPARSRSCEGAKETWSVAQPLLRKRKETAARLCG